MAVDVVVMHVNCSVTEQKNRKTAERYAAQCNHDASRHNANWSSRLYMVTVASGRLPLYSRYPVLSTPYPLRVNLWFDQAKRRNLVPSL